MDFFEAQDRAKSKTKLLVVLFALATLATGLAIYLAIVLILSQTGNEPRVDLLDWRLLGWTVGITATVIVCASAYKVSSLSSGGGAVAEMLGGKRVPPSSSDLGHQRLRNVVEEMAIAAGVRLPEIYVLENESSINAFAAGYTLDNAVVAVSRGCLEQLDREELQGVVAHEFSHILYGDMRINTRLVGIIFGILAVAVIGRVIFEITGRGAMYSRRSRDSKNGGAMAIVVLGLAIMVIGYIGVFFGRLIQSAISRQREFLADASAVQFTRNPSGISNALRKIKALAEGSRIRHPDAQEAGHLFFANGLKSPFASAFATHPPLEQRIAAIDPDSLYAKKIKSPRPTPEKPSRPERRERTDFVTSIAKDPAVTAMIGAATLANIPSTLANRARDPQGAFAIIEGCLNPSDTRLAGERLSPSDRFALLELALAAIKHLSQNEIQAGLKTLRQQALADQRVTIDEQCLLVAVERNLNEWNINADGKLVFFGTVKEQIETVLSAIALVDSGGDASVAQAAFDKAQPSLAGFGTKLTARFDRAQQANTLNDAIEETSRAIFAARKAVIDGAARIAASDDHLSEREQTLIRSLCLALGCPLPR